MKHVYICPYNTQVDCTRHPSPEHCYRCGHNPVEAARRSGYIEAGGLREGPDGLLGLRIVSQIRI